MNFKVSPFGDFLVTYQVLKFNNDGQSLLSLIGHMEYDDPIHGKISIPGYILQIIQTDIFQRLKHIKQLGFVYKTVPQANHTRYSHSIGTYHLAEKTLAALEDNTEGLQIPEFYKRAVEIAALLHDSGHGPLSHTWEAVCENYHHEQNSSGCIDEIFNTCHQEWMGDNKTYAIELIKSFIVGERSVLKEKKFLFLYEIVNNKRCGVDVDKWDYLKRDYPHIAEDLSEQNLLSRKNMRFEDVFMKARASEDRTYIEYRYCDFHKIYDIFYARATFHKHFYRKPKHVCLEQILKHIICESKEALERIDGIEIQDIRSEHVNAYLQLYDDEIWRILKCLKGSEQILRLVKCVENASITEIYPGTENEELAVPEYLKVKIRIANAGEEMQEENMRFYGNEAEKRSIDKQMGYNESVSYFKC